MRHRNGHRDNMHYSNNQLKIETISKNIEELYPRNQKRQIRAFWETRERRYGALGQTEVVMGGAGMEVDGGGEEIDDGRKRRKSSHLTEKERESIFIFY
ncbi:hypothetical protein L195_g041491 [Trifolium pratense]|uniref:Uncharacterized protein n=1 Tax=Trifolium pratense TaxID=57577 RepID=A0A2K3M3P8_TRIPR|nr:hypothetical protein L195_g041491 [Trifolium pratense]